MMDYKMMAQGMVRGLLATGVILEKWTDVPQPVVYISVPKYSENTNAQGEPLAGKVLADRVMTVLRDMSGVNAQVKFRVRDEVWTKAKGDKIINRF